MINTMGGLGVRNLQEEQSSRAPEIGGEKLKELFFERNDTCFGCPIACGKTLRLPPEQGGLRWKMPEYETLFSLGSMADNWDAAFLAQTQRPLRPMGAGYHQHGGDPLFRPGVF